MSRTPPNEFADLYDSVGETLTWKHEFIGGGIFLLNAAKKTLMERRGRWFSFIEDVYWKGFEGEIEYGPNSVEIRRPSETCLGSAMHTLDKPVTVNVGGLPLTFELVKEKWWTTNLVLKDDEGLLIDGIYGTREFRLLRATESLAVAVALYWILFIQENS